MSKRVKCCKQTSALDVATQWACAELLQRWACCITTTESSVLLRRHNRDYVTCMTQDAGKTEVKRGPKESGVGVTLTGTCWPWRGRNQCSAIIATTAGKQRVSPWHKFNTHNTVFTYSSAQPFPMRARIAKANIDTERRKKTQVNIGQQYNQRLHFAPIYALGERICHQHVEFR